MEDGPLFPYPTPEDQSRSTADEDAFFNHLLRSRNYLSNARYERWLWLKSAGKAASKLVRRLGVGEVLVDTWRRRWYALLSWVEGAKDVSPESWTRNPEHRRADVNRP
jgi:hypothetical protein